MANTPRAEVPIEIDGEHYTLRFGAGFVRRMEEAYPGPDGLPRPFETLFPKEKDPVTGKEKVRVGSAMVLRALWCALQPHHYDTFPTLDVLEEALGAARSIGDVTAKVTEGLTKAFAKPQRPPMAASPAPAASDDVQRTQSGPIGKPSSDGQP